MKDCLLSALHPASLLWESSKKTPGTLFYSIKMILLINLCLKQALTRPLGDHHYEWVPSCHPKENVKSTRAGFPKAAGWTPCTGVQCLCKPVPRGSLLSDTIKSPLQALRRGSCYTAPLIDANLSLSPAAFFDERLRGVTDHEMGFVPISPAATAHFLIMLLLQTPKPDNHCVKHLTAFWEWRVFCV